MTWDNANLVVVGPLQSYYETLIPEFARMPERVAAESSAGFIKQGFEAFVEKPKS